MPLAPTERPPDPSERQGSFVKIVIPPPFLAPLPQHLAFALTEPTFGKKAQGQDAGAMGVGISKVANLLKSLDSESILKQVQHRIQNDKIGISFVMT